MDVSDKPTVSLTRDKQLVSCIYTSGVMTTMSHGVVGQTDSVSHEA